jgi:hypothetical protein
MRITKQNNLRYQIWDEFEYQIYDQVYDQVLHRIYNQILLQVLYQVYNVSRDQVWKPILVNQK